MPCDRRIRGAPLAALLAVAVVLLPSIPAARAAAQEFELLLAVVRVNGLEHGVSLLARNVDEEFFAEASSILGWRLPVPDSDAIEIQGRRYYALSALTGLKTTFTQSNMLLAVDVPARLLGATSHSLARPAAEPRRTESIGAYLDYDAAYVRDSPSNEDNLSGLLRPRVFTRFGSLSSDVLYNSHGSAYGSAISGWQRLTTTWTLDDPSRMRSIRVGDAITAASSWARALRFGGVQIASNFDTRPSEVVFPQPQIYGTAAVPSTLDVFVNGQLRSQLEVPGGSFEINDIPVVTGSGQVRVVARDLLGREQLLTQDFYTSDRLLRPGLNEYSLSLGRVRRDFAVRRNAYGPTLLSGMLRRGLTEQLTVGGQFLSTTSQRVVGISVARTGGFGVTTAATALSQAKGSGQLWLLGHQYQGQRFRGDMRIQHTTARFSQPGLESLQPFPKRQVSLSAGFGLRRNGSVGISLVGELRHGGERRQISSLSYSRTLPAGLTLSVAASKVTSRSGFREASISLSRSLGPRSSTSVSLSRRNDGDGTRVDHRYELPKGPGFGYRTSIERGYRDVSEAAFLLNTSFSHYGVEARSQDGDRAIRLQSRGSLARYGGAWFATREISNGFAVVDAGGIEGVNVYLENRPVGKTRADGRLIVPGLRPYELNRIRIETADVPIETRVESSQLNVTPFYRSGILASFGIRTTASVLLRAVFPDGQPVPEGARASVANNESSSPVGLDGRLYVEDIGPGNRIEIEARGETCVIDIGESITHEGPNFLGDIICRNAGQRDSSGSPDQADE